MKILELIRLEEGEEGTFGVLRIDKKVFCMTLEPQDRENKPNVSSIPAQQYICQRWKSPRFGKTFIVTNVPDRHGILFHPGNLQEDTEGCILLGQHIDKLRDARAVKNSGGTFRMFMQQMSEEGTLHLTITENY